MINGVAGCGIRPRGGVNFKVAGVKSGGKQIKVEASVLPKVNVNLPTVPVSPVTSGSTCQIWLQFGPTGATSTFKTCFSWVLNGEVKGKSRRATTHLQCCRQQ